MEKNFEHISFSGYFEKCVHYSIDILTVCALKTVMKMICVYSYFKKNILQSSTNMLFIPFSSEKDESKMINLIVTK